MRTIYVIGSLNLDLVMTSARLPEAGETCHGTAMQRFHGGKGANQAVAAAKLGGHVRFCGCVGTDSFGQSMIDNLIAHHIHVEHVHQIEGMFSGTAAIHVIDGDNRILIFPGANASVTADHVKHCLASANAQDILLMQLETPLETVHHALQVAKAKKMITLFNPAPVDDRCLPWLRLVDVLIVNELEATHLSQEADYQAAATWLRAQGAKQVIVTRGAAGAFALLRDTTMHLRAPNVDVIDTTGAGDAFCGALAYALAANQSMSIALQLAIEVGSYAVTRLGAQSAYPNSEEVQGSKLFT